MCVPVSNTMWTHVTAYLRVKAWDLARPTNEAQPSFLTFQLKTQVIVETRERRFIQQDYHGELNNRSPVTPKSVFTILT